MRRRAFQRQRTRVAYAAALAVGLAEKRIPERLTPQNQQALVGAFVRGLERPPQ